MFGLFTWAVSGRLGCWASRCNSSARIGCTPGHFTAAALGLLPPSDDLARLGQVLAAGCGIRGLFGVDCVEENSVFWPVEINPRYTASVEVLEYASGLPALACTGRSSTMRSPDRHSRTSRRLGHWQGHPVRPPGPGLSSMRPWTSGIGIHDPWKTPPFRRHPRRHADPPGPAGADPPDPAAVVAACRSNCKRGRGAGSPVVRLIFAWPGTDFSSFLEIQSPARCPFVKSAEGVAVPHLE